MGGFYIIFWDESNKYAALLILCFSVFPPWPFNHKRVLSEYMLVHYLLIFKRVIVFENSKYLQFTCFDTKTLGFIQYLGNSNFVVF